MDATIPGEIEATPTLYSIGLRWWIEGDDDLDCAVSIAFRDVGLGSPWREGQPLLRVEPARVSGHAVDPGNLLAGSILDLAPGTAYEVRLSLSDPDGGAAEESLLLNTRASPQAAPDARILHVIPGEGGGSGTSEDPFRGLAEADAQAQPGDLFLLAPGIYHSITLTASGLPGRPIVWRGAGMFASILDGEGLDSVVVRAREVSDLILEDLAIRRPHFRGVLGSGTSRLTFRRCFLDVPRAYEDDVWAFDLRGRSHTGAIISDCVLRGPIRWEDGRHEDHYGISIVGRGHVLERNAVFNWWDGIQVGADRESVVTADCDVRENEIYSCTDDGIETDASRDNIRVQRNRITNVLTGVSCQPVYGGPVYITRNVVYNWQLKPLKFHLWPGGTLVYHNTFVGADPKGWGDCRWRNGTLRNNIFVGGSQSGHSGDPIALDTYEARCSLDHDGWYQALPDRFARYDWVDYPTLEEFRAATGMEEHGVLLDLTAFIDAEEPPLGSWLGEEGYFEPYEPGSQDLRLAPGSVAEDAGMILADINDGYGGERPDLGAYETGDEIPHYGPADFEAPIAFLRGDGDSDGLLTVSDAVVLLGAFVHGEPLPACRDVADVDDSGHCDPEDALFELQYLFAGGPAPPGPGGCAYDLTPDTLTCDEWASCAGPPPFVNPDSLPPDPGDSLRLPSTGITPPDTAVFSIEASNDRALAALEGRIRFDPARLQFLELLPAGEGLDFDFLSGAEGEEGIRFGAVPGLILEGPLPPGSHTLAHLRMLVLPDGGDGPDPYIEDGRFHRADGSIALLHPEGGPAAAPGQPPKPRSADSADSLPPLLILSNPYTPASAIRLTRVRDGTRVDLDVIDARGRRVRGLYHGPWGPSASGFSWDGRTARSLEAPSGVYYLYGHAGRWSLHRTLLLLRP